MLLPVLTAFVLATGTPTRPMQAPDGKAIFEASCRRCHGPAGQPSTAMKRLMPELPTWDEAFFAARSDSAIVDVLINGKGKNMKPWKDVLKPAEMDAVAKYIRTLKP